MNRRKEQKCFKEVKICLEAGMQENDVSPNNYRSMTNMEVQRERLELSGRGSELKGKEIGPYSLTTVYGGENNWHKKIGITT